LQSFAYMIYCKYMKLKILCQIFLRRISQSEIRNSAAAGSEGGQKFIPPNALGDFPFAELKRGFLVYLCLKVFVFLFSYRSEQSAQPVNFSFPLNYVLSILLPYNFFNDFKYLVIFRRYRFKEPDKLLFHLFFSNVCFFRTLAISSVVVTVPVPMTFLEFPRNQTTAMLAMDFRLE